MVQDSGERQFTQLTHGFVFLFIAKSVAKLWLLLLPQVDRPESLVIAVSELSLHGDGIMETPQQYRYNSHLGYMRAVVMLPETPMAMAPVTSFSINCARNISSLRDQTLDAALERCAFPMSVDIMMYNIIHEWEIAGSKSIFLTGSQMNCDHTPTHSGCMAGCRHKALLRAFQYRQRPYALCSERRKSWSARACFYNLAIAS